MTRIRLHFESRLAAPPAAILRQALTMDGVNYEMMPLLRMTYPRQFRHEHLRIEAAGKLLFRCWLLLFGFLPIDRYALCFERVLPNGFDERSTSWLFRRFSFHRRVIPQGAAACVIDDVEFEPRLPGTAVLLGFFMRRLFANRHRRLRERYHIAPVT